MSLVVDEMDIRKHLSFDGNKFVGNVDLGDNRETGDDDEVASEALVFLVVALNNSWKLPVGYFLINGLGSSGTYIHTYMHKCIHTYTHTHMYLLSDTV